MRLQDKTNFPFAFKHLRSISLATLKLPITITANVQKTIDNRRLCRITQAGCVYIATAPYNKGLQSTYYIWDIRTDDPKYTV